MRSAGVRALCFRIGTLGVGDREGVGGKIGGARTDEDADGVRVRAWCRDGRGEREGDGEGGWRVTLVDDTVEGSTGREVTGVGVSSGERRRSSGRPRAKWSSLRRTSSRHSTRSGKTPSN